MNSTKMKHAQIQQSQRTRNIPIRYDPNLTTEFSKTEPSTSGTTLLKMAGRTFGSIAVFIVVIIIIVNLLTLFPAIAIVTPELTDLHSACMETEIPFQVDNTPPVITEISVATSVHTLKFNGTPPEPIGITSGELFKIIVEATDTNLDEVTAEFVNTTNNLIYNPVTKCYETKLPAPAEIGRYYLALTATDLALNYANTGLTIQTLETSLPIIQLKGYRAQSIITSGTELEFTVSADRPVMVQYRHTTPTALVTRDTLTSPYIVSTDDWSEGKHTLEISANVTNGVSSSNSFTVIVDDTAPEITAVKIQPLTAHRNEVFGLKLPDNNFHRGECVKVTAKLTDLYSNQVSIKIIPEDESSERGSNSEPGPGFENVMGYNPTQDKFQVILSLSEKIGKYRLVLVANDLANNTKTYRDLTFTVARINVEGMQVPILMLKSPIKAVAISSHSSLKFSVIYGQLDGLHYNFNNNVTELEPVTSFNVTGLDDGIYLVTIHASRSDEYLDGIFITLPLPPFIFILFIIQGFSLVIYFLFIAAMLIIANFMLFYKNGEDYFRSLSKFITTLQPPSIKTDNALVMIAHLFLAILFLNVAYSIILSLFEVTPHTPAFGEQPIWMLLYNLASAAAWEEIISRTLLLGVPLLIIHIIADSKQAPSWKYLVGGGFEIKIAGAFLILFSAAVFGLAHAPGWDYWKVFTSFVSGLAFGYLFLRKGLYASMILHFTINYLTMPLSVAGEPVALVILFNIALMLLICVGMVMFGYYTVRVFRWLGGRG